MVIAMFIPSLRYGCVTLDDINVEGNTIFKNQDGRPDAASYNLHRISEALPPGYCFR
jgi:hypothetical protein